MQSPPGQVQRECVYTFFIGRASWPYTMPTHTLPLGLVIKVLYALFLPKLFCVFFFFWFHSISLLFFFSSFLLFLIVNGTPVRPSIPQGSKSRNVSWGHLIGIFPSLNLLYPLTWITRNPGWEAFLLYSWEFNCYALALACYPPTVNSWSTLPLKTSRNIPNVREFDKGQGGNPSGPDILNHHIPRCLGRPGLF